MGKIFVALISIVSGIAIGTLAEHWKLDTYVKYLLIWLAVIVPLQLYKMKKHHPATR